MPNAEPASKTAIAIPASAATHTRFFNTNSTKNRVNTGSADTAVDRGQERSGS
jgi:hypothetical protein